VQLATFAFEVEHIADWQNWLVHALWNGPVVVPIAGLMLDLVSALVSASNAPG
jgi:hypothetical protein